MSIVEILRLILGFLGVGLAAFCVWLTVRIVNRRERWAVDTAIGLGIAFVIFLAGRNVGYFVLWLRVP